MDLRLAGQHIAAKPLAHVLNTADQRIIAMVGMKRGDHRATAEAAEGPVPGGSRRAAPSGGAIRL
jgi:hypothetical protein